jgi:hypothetical protein
MSKSKHTPGPWRAQLREFPEGQWFLEGQWEVVSTCEIEWLIAAAAPHIDGDPDEANARLIAAAPELLEALHSVYAFINREYHDPEATVEGEYVTREARPIWAKICTAIAKAEGETP